MGAIYNTCLLLNNNTRKRVPVSLHGTMLKTFTTGIALWAERKQSRAPCVAKMVLRRSLCAHVYYMYMEGNKYINIYIHSSCSAIESYHMSTRGAMASMLSCYIWFDFNPLLQVSVSAMIWRLPFLYSLGKWSGWVGIKEGAFPLEGWVGGGGGNLGVIPPGKKKKYLHLKPLHCGVFWQKF